MTDARAADWGELPYFLAIARTGSLRAAAEVVGGTHATVDRHLKALETAYGVRLFDRSPAGLSLTPAGEALLPKAEEAERVVIAARRKVSGLDRVPTGRVHLSLPPWLAYDVLAPSLARFAAAHPGIELRTTVTNRIQDLVRAEADVSLRVAFSVEEDVVGRRLLQYNSATFASREYLDRYWEGRGPEGQGLHWIGWGEAKPVPDWVRASPFPKAVKRHWVRDGMMQVQLVRAGMGMGIFPVYAQHQFPDLVQVPGTPLKPDRSLWLLLHSDLRRTTRVRLLVDHLAAEFTGMRKSFVELAAPAVSPGCNQPDGVSDPRAVGPG